MRCPDLQDETQKRAAILQCEADRAWEKRDDFPVGSARNSLRQRAVALRALAQGGNAALGSRRTEVAFCSSVTSDGDGATAAPAIMMSAPAGPAIVMTAAATMHAAVTMAMAAAYLDRVGRSLHWCQRHC